MNALNIVKIHLEREKKLNKTIFNYTIPDVWDTNQLSKPDTHVGDGHIMINPYDFMIETIEAIMDVSSSKHLNYGQPYYHYNHFPAHLDNGNWIKSSVVYSMMIRSSSSFDHDRSGKLDSHNIYDLKDTGTFLKTIMLLPTLKKLGVDTLYLLPISKYSLRGKKGEAGSPYGVANFFKLDENLKDPLTGTQCSVETELKALVEAAHICDMKVVIDIIPRTNSVNSDFILTNPEWFYWVKTSDLEKYHPPVVDTLEDTLPADKKYFKDLFASEDVLNHIKLFVQNPKDQDPVKFNKMVEMYQREKPDIEPLDLIEQHFGVSIAYAFSDHINDPQPAWSDITYFRMFLDHPINSQPYLEKLDYEVQPYILFDVAKSSLNPGSIPNTKLWEVLSDIIPFYQENYGIDGARIDMGHALPLDLVKMIIEKAKKNNPQFCFIAEELDVKRDQVSLDNGYNMIIGDGFSRIPSLDGYGFNDFVYSVRNLACPVFACGETHDTPRLAAREGGKTQAKMSMIYDYFIPNAIPFINSGQEFFEIAPMNLGIGARDNEQFLLDPKDPYYGKLALFDYVAFHNLEADRFELMNEVSKILPIRQKYLEAILDIERSAPLYFDSPYVRAVATAFENQESCLIALAHTNYHHDDVIAIHLHNLPQRFKQNNIKVVELYSTDHHQLFEFNLYPNQDRIELFVKAGEVKLLELRLVN